MLIDVERFIFAHGDKNVLCLHVVYSTVHSLESTMEHIVSVVEKTCNKKVKTCPPTRYQAYRPGTPHWPSGLKAIGPI